MLNYQRVNAKKMEIVGLAELAGRCNQDSEDRQAAERASRTDGEGCREGAGTALNCLSLAGVRKLKDQSLSMVLP